MAKLRFLIVDDDSDDAQLLTEALGRASPNIICDCVTDGEQVFSLLDGNTEWPQMIFLDINMPVMDGWHCLEGLKQHEQYKDIPVLMYSTSTLSRDVKKAIKLGAIGFVSKPSSFREIESIAQGIYSKVVAQKVHEITEVKGVTTQG